MPKIWRPTEAIGGFVHALYGGVTWFQISVIAMALAVVAFAVWGLIHA